MDGDIIIAIKRPQTQFGRNHSKSESKRSTKYAPHARTPHLQYLYATVVGQYLSTCTSVLYTKSTSSYCRYEKDALNNGGAGETPKNRN